MFQSAILDVATGLILVFLVLALVCTSINEYIAQILSLRAEILWKAVCSLFQNCNAGGAEQFARQLYDHDLVDSLSPPGGKPSYIPAQIFSLALVDHLDLHTGDSVSKTLTSSVAQLLDDAKTANQALDGAARIDGRIFDTLRPLAVAAGNNVDAFRQNIENWFDSSMQRASGWYKKRVQVIIFFVGFAVALVFNADSLMLTNALWANPAARSQLAASAKSVSGPVGGAVQETAGNSIPTLNTPAIQQASSNVMSLIGWSGPISPSMSGYKSADTHRFPADFGSWITKVVGLLITAFAVSLGAPFWFGVLGKVMSIRNAGPSPSDKQKQPGRIASTGGNTKGDNTDG